MNTPVTPAGKTSHDNRIASLDFLRGAAAMAVAVAHYLMLAHEEQNAAMVVSILAVEVFFVLSGYVLAPQILLCLTSLQSSDTLTFLTRRWMRTVPPYLVALAVITIVTGNLYSKDLIYYAFYIQNFFSSLPDGRDYYSVAWSLSVEEWFYLVFAAIIIGSRALGLRARGLLVVAILFIALVTAARMLFGDYAAWDGGVRRVFVFRADSITYGFVLFCARGWLTSRAENRIWRLVLLALALASVPAAYLAGWSATVDHDRLGQHLYPLTAALFGASTIFVLHHYREVFQLSAMVAGFCYFAGKVSYSIYLFHVIAILLLREPMSGLPITVQLGVYCILLTAWCWAFYTWFEAPILAARPRYSKTDAARANLASRFRTTVTTWISNARQRTTMDWLRLMAIILFAAAAIAGAERLHQSQYAWSFYISACAAAAALIALSIEAGAWRRAFVRIPLLAALAAAIVLPGADYLFQQSRQKQAGQAVKPVYSFEAANGNGAAFNAWWARYTNEWQKGAQAAIEMPDPQRSLPFLVRPNVRSKFFEAEVRINNLGFRGPDIALQKGRKFRIVALGESPTFGTMIKAGELSWPAALQELINTQLACTQSVEVINAGVPGYALVHNIERFRRSIARLQPDAVVSYHGFNGLHLIDPVLGQLPVPPIYKPRASPLLAAFRFNVRMSKYSAARDAFGKLSPQTQFSDRYAELYKSLADETRRAGAKLYIANLATAVNRASPAEVIEFYGRVFTPIDRKLDAIAEHNRIARQFASQNGLPFIDTRGGIAGNWKQDLFIDLVHFTQKGSRLLAGKVFNALKPDLLNSRPGCTAVARSQ